VEEGEVVDSEAERLLWTLEELPDPYPDWARARGSEPVMRVTDALLGQETYLVHRRTDVDRILRDAATFCSRINDDHMGPFMGHTIVAMDGDEHKRHRDLLAKAFRPSAIERWRDELIVPTIQTVLDEIAPRGRADLVADITARFPVQVIAAIIGVPVDDYDQFQRWADDITLGPRDAARSKAASQAMTEYLAPIVEERRRHPSGDLLSELVTAEVDGHVLDDDHLYGFLRLLLPAGAETTYRLLGNCLFALLTHPGALDEVRADAGLIPAVVEETLRWETSVTMVSREATKDVVVSDCPVPAGAWMVVLTGSANRDESYYEDPEQWELHRPPKPHLAFGTGHHQCLGMHLGRLELRVALEAIVDRLPNLRLDPDFPPPEILGLPFRSPKALHVRFGEDT
jgi:cytochrome P450